MSATLTTAASRTKTVARCYAVVANELYESSLEIVLAYGLPPGILTSRLDVIMNGLRVWIAAKQLTAVTVELLDRDDKLVRKWEFPVDFSEGTLAEDVYESDKEEFRAFLAQDRVKVHSYRLLVHTNTADRIDVPGWVRATASDDSHLKRRKIAEKLVATKFARTSAYVFTDSFPEIGDPQ